VITGAAGYLGSALARRLRTHTTVHALVHPRTDAARLDGLTDILVHRVDLADPVATARVLAGIGSASVLHAAAPRGHAWSGRRTALWRDSVLATTSLLDALDQVGAERLVHLGSSLAYGPSARPLREDDPLAPVTPRGAAKAAASLAVQEWGTATGVPVTDLRLFRVYGPGEQPWRLVPALLRCLATGEPLPVPATPTRRDMVHVDDVVEACVRSLALPGVSTLNVGYGVGHTVHEIAAAFSQAAGRPLRLVPGARAAAPHDVLHHAADLTRTQQILGWQPRIDLNRGAAMVVAAS
jgi:nucleoside-diphosphate-sugar epimerase